MLPYGNDVALTCAGDKEELPKNLYSAKDKQMNLIKS
jgi:hypothetical protein